MRETISIVHTTMKPGKYICGIEGRQSKRQKNHVNAGNTKVNESIVGCLQGLLASEQVTCDYLLLTLIQPHTASKDGVLPSKFIQQAYTRAGIETNSSLTHRQVEQISAWVQDTYLITYRQTIFPDNTSSRPGLELGVGFLTLDIHLTDTFNSMSYIDHVVALSKLVWHQHSIETQDELHVSVRVNTENRESVDIRTVFNVFGTLKQHYRFFCRLQAQIGAMHDSFKQINRVDAQDVSVNDNKEDQTVNVDGIRMRDILHKARMLQAFRTMTGAYDYLYDDMSVPTLSSSQFRQTDLITVGFQKGNKNSSDMFQRDTTIVLHGSGQTSGDMYSGATLPITRYSVSV